MKNFYNNSVAVSIVESPKPILWLDTHIVIRMTKAKLGERIGDDLKRYLSFYEKIFSLVCDGRIICPIAEQGEEISHGRSLEKPCYELQLALSRGVQFRHGEEIRSIQRKKAMLCFLHREKEICLSYVDCFDEDPCTEVQKTLGFIIGVYGKQGNQVLNKEIETKKRMVEVCNSLKKFINNSGIKYHEQFEREQKGLLQALMQIIDDWRRIYAKHLEPTLSDVEHYLLLSRLLSEWEQCGGEAGDIAGLITFLASDEYKILPHVDISSMLWAKLLVNSGDVASGDSMDIYQLSTVIPFCKYVISDRKMRNILHELGVDNKYNTSIYCMHDYKKLIEELNRFEKA